MNDKDNFQILRDERTKLVNQIADLQTENAQLREAANTGLCDICGKPSTSTIKGEKIFFAIFGVHRECADNDSSLES